MFRNLFRFVALFFVSSLFVATGLSCLLHPATVVIYLQENSLLPFLRELGVLFLEPSNNHFLEAAARIFGGVVVLISACLLLGVYRRFAALLLALTYAVALGIDLKLEAGSFSNLEQSHKMEILKGLSIIGGLLFIVGSGKGNRFKRAKEVYDIEKKKK